MTQLKIKGFTPDLYDVIIPEVSQVNPIELSCIFLVMEYIPSDLRTVIETNQINEQNKNVFVHIIYNMLCSTKFIHMANIMHRDYKPDNFLIHYLIDTFYARIQTVSY